MINKTIFLWIVLALPTNLYADSVNIQRPVPPKASQSEAEAGTDNSKMMTPLRTQQAVTSLGGNVTGQASSVDSEISLFSGTTGKVIKRATTTGIVKSTSGVIGAAVAGDFPTLNQNTTGNAATVTTNANLTGHVTSTGNAAILGSFSSANLLGALSDETGTGVAVFGTSPAFTTQITTPSIISTGALGVTPASGSNVNITLATTGDFAVNTSQLYVDTSAGYVGIGTTLPGAKLDVQNSTDAASNLVAIFKSGDRAVPTNNDNGYISFYNDNSTGTQVEFSRLTWKAIDVLSTSKDSQLEFAVMGANTLTSAMYLGLDDNIGALAIGAQPIFTTSTLFDDNHFGHTALQLTGADASPPIAILNAFSSTTNRAADLDFTWSRGSTYNSTTIVQDGDRLGRINWVAADGVDLDNAGATIQAVVDGTPGLNDTPGRLEFLTTNDGNRAPTVKMTIKESGYVGIGTSTPSAQLHTTETVRMQNFGAGTATFDANGNISSVSDERLKTISGNFSSGLSEILQIKPIVYKWNEKSGLDITNNYVGFSAQNLSKYIPEAVSINSEGYLSVSDRAVIAALVNAVKTLSDEVDSLKLKLSLPLTSHTVVANTDITKLGKTNYAKILRTPVLLGEETMEYVEEGTESKAQAVSAVDAFTLVPEYTQKYLRDEVKTEFILEGEEVKEVTTTVPIYEQVFVKNQKKLKENVSLNSETGTFYKNVEIPKLVYKMKKGVSFDEVTKVYMRDETSAEALARVGKEIVSIIPKL